MIYDENSPKTADNSYKFNVAHSKFHPLANGHDKCLIISSEMFTKCTLRTSTPTDWMTEWILLFMTLCIILGSYLGFALENTHLTISIQLPDTSPNGSSTNWRFEGDKGILPIVCLREKAHHFGNYANQRANNNRNETPNDMWWIMTAAACLVRVKDELIVSPQWPNKNAFALACKYFIDCNFVCLLIARFLCLDCNLTQCTRLF